MIDQGSVLMDVVIVAWSEMCENSWFTSVMQLVAQSRHIGDNHVKSIVVLACVVVGG